MNDTTVKSHPMRIATLFFFLSFFIHSAHAITLDDFLNPASESQQVQANGAGSTASISIPSSRSVGGVRGISVQVQQGSIIRAEQFINGSTGRGTFSHSSNQGSRGISTIILDGAMKAPGSPLIQPQGLAGLNLTEDGGTRFLLDDLQCDFANGAQCLIVMTVYDSADSSGATFSSRSFLLTQGADPSQLNNAFIFADFAQGSGATAPASFNRVGAVVLTVLGTLEMDLSLSRIRTDGVCTHIPVQKLIYDSCGVCNGDGASCKIECKSADIKDTLFELDAQAKRQDKLIIRSSRIILKTKGARELRAKLRDLLSRANQLQIRSWVVSWTIPERISSCVTSTACTVSSHQPLLEEYRMNAAELFSLSEQVSGFFRQLGANGRARLHSRQGLALYQGALKLAETVPTTTSVCRGR
jgi:hypothetical protein